MFLPRFSFVQIKVQTHEYRSFKNKSGQFTTNAPRDVSALAEAQACVTASPSLSHGHALLEGPCGNEVI